MIFGIFLLMKVLLEAAGFSLNAAALPVGVQVAWQAHLLAIIFGFCIYGRHGITGDRLWIHLIEPTLKKGADETCVSGANASVWSARECSI